MYEYKVITERDSRLAGNFDLGNLESTLNSWAAEGWRLTEGFLATSVWKGIKAELVMVLERPANDPE